MKKYLLLLIAFVSSAFAIAPGAFPQNPFIPSATPGDLTPIYTVLADAQMGQLMADMDGLLMGGDTDYIVDSANAYGQVEWLCYYMEAGPTTYPVRNMYLAISLLQFPAEARYINGDAGSLGADRAYSTILVILQGLGGNP